MDNDCNGSIDEGCTCTIGVSESCGTDLGECVMGTRTCLNNGFGAGQWSDCGGVGFLPPAPETCDTLDNDCDTEVDEGCSCVNGTAQPCGDDTGECSRGTQTCVMGRWNACTGFVGPAPEVCTGTLDENCNGLVNEDCICTPGATRACGTDLGACVSGLETCTDGRYWGVCVGYVAPAASESCDTIDNDCDGDIDEGCSCVDGTTQPDGHGRLRPWYPDLQRWSLGRLRRRDRGFARDLRRRGQRLQRLDRRRVTQLLRDLRTRAAGNLRQRVGRQL
ncbi:hypothetical protein HZB93_00555 [Candidatus Falkowbacteria bacterium]|nr:hypothetical protein [Candidatus Falkowbacteria bacterium]